MKTWEKTVAEAIARGGKVIAPNNLPISCVRHDDVCLEHEHADHPEYKFPVEVVYIGIVPPMPDDWDAEDEWRAGFVSETHALIWHDGFAAVTLFEACYFLWILSDGQGYGSIHHQGWVLSPESCEKVRSL